MSEEWALEVRTYGLELDDDELDWLEGIYEDEGIPQHFSDTVLVLARDEDGDIIGGLTESGGDELTIGIDEGWQGHGIGTAMVKALIAEGGGGFMVAGTDAGSEFLYGLYQQLTEEEREELDVPSWLAFEDDE